VIPESTSSATSSLQVRHTGELFAANALVGGIVEYAFDHLEKLQPLLMAVALIGIDSTLPLSFSVKRGALESLKDSVRCGLSPSSHPWESFQA